MARRSLIQAALLFATGIAAQAFAAEVEPALKTLRAVAPNGVGHREATEAWRQLSQADAAALPAILAGVDGAGPLAANWIRAAIDAIAERQLQQGGSLPSAGLEQFIRDVRHAPRARRLAYEWLVRVDPAARERLIPGMLDDPSTELRRDAVAGLIEQASVLTAPNKKDDAVKVFRRALNAARDMDQVKLLGQRLRKLDQPVDFARQLGYVVHWKLIAPFDNTDRKGFAVAYPPETEFRLDAVYSGKHGPVRWTDFASSDDFGKIDFHKAFTEEKQVIGYATTEFLTDRRREVQIRLSSFNAIKLWLNGKLVAEYPVYHSGGEADQYVSLTTLQPGRNVILVKVCQNEQTQDWTRRWDFQLRVCESDGGAVLSSDR